MSTLNQDIEHSLSPRYYSTNEAAATHHHLYRTPTSSPHMISRATFTYSMPEDSLVVPRHWFLDNVSMDASKVLGRGSFGTVCLGEWLGCSVAIKKPHDIFFDKSVSESERGAILKTFAREITIMFRLKHPNIVLFYGLHDASGGPCEPPVREDVTFLSSDTCLVQELLQCSLSSRNRQMPRLTYRNTVDLSMGITGGIRYLHERDDPIIHRDLASKNILLNHNGIPKIADLGVARVINTSRKFNNLSRQPGTELYMPPEVKIEGMQYGTQIDIYSLGVIILEMSVGRDPTAGESFRTTTGPSEGNNLCLVPEVERRRRDLLDLGDSPLRSMILRCLSRKEDRPSALEVFNELENLKTQRYYSNQLDTPIMPQSVDHWPHPPATKMATPTPHQPNDHEQHQTILEERIKLLEEEKEELLMKLASGKREGGSLPNRLDDFLSTYPNGNRTSSNHEISQKYLDQERLSRHGQYNGVQSSSGPPSGASDQQHKIRLLEATVRSRDSEIKSLRDRNIGLEQDIAGFQDMYSSTNGYLHTKEKQVNNPQVLLSRGVPLSPPPYVNGSNHLTSNGSASVENELKQVKRNLEKYKNLTVELDSKLKDARLELSKHESRQTGSHVQARYESEALRSENLALRSEVDRLRRECSHLQSQNLYHHHRY